MWSHKKWGCYAVFCNLLGLSSYSDAKFSMYKSFLPLFVPGHGTQYFFSNDARLGGATVARLTPVQKVACSNHVRVTSEVLQRRLETKCGAIRNGVVMLCFVIY